MVKSSKHMRVYEPVTRNEPDEWHPRVAKPDGHTVGHSDNPQASRVYDETYAVVEGHLRRVSNAE